MDLMMHRSNGSNSCSNSNCGDDDDNDDAAFCVRSFSKKLLWLAMATTGITVLLFLSEGAGPGGVGVANNLREYSSSSKTTTTTTTTKSCQQQQQQQQQQSQDDNNEHEDDDDKRPYFILHVGLQKTGTTFLQNTLCSELAKETLLQDDYIWLGGCNRTTTTATNMTPKITIPKGNHPLFFSVNNTYHNLPKFLAIPDFLYQILKAKESGQSLILSQENISKMHPSNVAALAAVLNPIFRVRVIVVYRRLYEWLPSWHNMYYKVNVDTGKTWAGKQITWNSPKNGQGSGLSFDLDNRFGPGTSDIVSDIELLQQHPAQMVYNKFAQFFHNVIVMNLHNLPTVHVPVVPSSSSSSLSHPTISNNHDDGSDSAAIIVDPTLHHFICSIIPHATQTCHAVEQGIVRGSTHNNPSTSFDYDMLAMAARGYFIIPKSNNHLQQQQQQAATSLSRIQVGNEIMKYNDQLKQEQKELLIRNDKNYDDIKTLESFPRTCLSNEKLNRLLQLSLMGERNLFPTWTNQEVEIEHRDNFDAFQSKLCSLDTQAVLNDPVWQSFLKSLVDNDSSLSAAAGAGADGGSW